MNYYKYQVNLKSGDSCTLLSTLISALSFFYKWLLAISSTPLQNLWMSFVVCSPLCLVHHFLNIRLNVCYILEVKVKLRQTFFVYICYSLTHNSITLQISLSTATNFSIKRKWTADLVSTLYKQNCLFQLKEHYKT